MSFVSILLFLSWLFRCLDFFPFGVQHLRPDLLLRCSILQEQTQRKRLSQKMKLQKRNPSSSRRTNQLKKQRRRTGWQINTIRNMYAPSYAIWCPFFFRMHFLKAFEMLPAKSRRNSKRRGHRFIEWMFMTNFGRMGKNLRRIHSTPPQFNNWNLKMIVSRNLQGGNLQLFPNCPKGACCPSRQPEVWH